MKFQENHRLRGIKPYKASSPKAWAYSNDPEVLKLDWTESTINPSPKVFEAVNRLIINKKWNWYPDINNTVLIKALASYCGARQSQIQFFASSDALHEYIVRCYVSSEDKILVVTPTYDNFRAVAETNGGNVQNYNLNSNYELDFQQLQKDIKHINPKIFYLVNPNNPTGKFIKLETLITSNPNILFIIDEAYFEFTSLSIANLTNHLENLIISRTFSKAFGLASFRIGYCIANESIIDTLNKIRNPKSVSLFAQEAALAALNDIQYVASYVEEVNLAKDMFFEFLRQQNWAEPIKGSGNFIFVEIKDNLKGKLISFLEENKVFIRDYGHLEQTENFVRITIGTIDQMKKLISLISIFKV